MKKLTKFEKSLVELVHFLAYGDRLDFGLTLEETVEFLTKPIPHKSNKTAIECLKEDKEKFIEYLKDYLEQRS